MVEHRASIQSRVIQSWWSSSSLQTRYHTLTVYTPHLQYVELADYVIKGLRSQKVQSRSGYPSMKLTATSMLMWTVESR